MAVPSAEVRIELTAGEEPTPISAKSTAGRSTSSLDKFDPLEISIQNVSFEVDRVVKQGRAPWAKVEVETKQILKGITGTFKPGRMTCVMGASGAGKTSLLNVLAGESTTGRVGGTITVNGQSVTTKEMKSMSGFVFQDDVILDTMTVKEAVTMSARLRLPTTMTLAEKEQVVDDVLATMRLTKAQNTIIGNPSVKGVSGGERKRTALSMELVTSPSVLFLDEPTSGLDTFTAFTVCEILKTLAKGGRTIVATIHQPSSELFFLFDDICLLSEGRVVYFGPVVDIVAYFARMDYKCPQYSNPAGIGNVYFLFMSVLNANKENNNANTAEKEKDRLKLLASHWEASEEFKLVREQATDSKVKGGLSKTSYKYLSSNWNQFSFLIGRAWRNALRNKFVWRVKFMQALIVSVVFSLVYRDVEGSDTATQVIQNITGILYLSAINMFMSAATGVLNAFSVEREVFLREQKSGYYRLMPYFLSKTIVELPGYIVFPAIQSLIMYWIVGLATIYWYQFPVFMLCGIAVSICGASMGLLFSALLPNVQVALAIFPLVFMPLMLVSGLFVNNGSIPPYIDWLKYLSPMKYGFEALVKNQFTGWSRSFDVRLPSGVITSVTTNGEDVISQLGMDDGLSVASLLAILFSLYVGLTISSALGLFSATRKKRH